MAILTSDKADFRAKKIAIGKEGNYMMTKKINPPRTHSYPVNQTTELPMYEAKTKTAARRNL